MNSLLLFAQYYTTTTTTTQTSYEKADPAMIALAIMLLVIFFIFVYALHAVLLARIFKKAGIKQSIAWVPFYNTWKMLEMGGQQGFWSPLAVVPFVSYVSAVYLYIAMYKIGIQFGKQGSFIVLGIFLPTVWMAWLAFDDSKWNSVSPAATPTYQPPTA